MSCETYVYFPPGRTTGDRQTSVYCSTYLMMSAALVLNKRFKCEHLQDAYYKKGEYDVL